MAGSECVQVEVGSAVGQHEREAKDVSEQLRAAGRCVRRSTRCQVDTVPMKEPLLAVEKVAVAAVAIPVFAVVAEEAAEQVQEQLEEVKRFEQVVRADDAAAVGQQQCSPTFHERTEYA